MLSIDKMRETYWALGTYWWKQIIDGNCHEFGAEVFDKGLHGGAKEPGFLKSLFNGMQYASSELGKPLTVDFYKTLHQKLCAHFAGDKTDTLFYANDAGKFRSQPVFALMQLKYIINPIITKQYLILEMSEALDRAIPSRSILFSRTPRKLHKEIIHAWKKTTHEHFPQKARFLKKFINELEAIIDLDIFLHKNKGNARSIIEEWENNWAKKVHDLNQYIEDISRELNSPLFVKFSIKTFKTYADPNEKYIKLDYASISPTLLEEQAKKLFDDFNRKIKTAGTDQMKLTLIADLYQKLEWFHFFIDGQGRTDLVLLSKILTENGFHPVILEHPYFSSTSTLNEWVVELQKGLVAWENLYHQLHSIPQQKKPSARL